MKHFLLTLAAFAILVGCASSKLTPEQKAQQKARQAMQVNANIRDHKFSVLMTYMTPLRGGGRALSSGYYITVENNKLTSALPYAGEARNLPYGGGKGLNFVAPIKSYKVEAGKNESTIITIESANDEDNFIYRVEVFPNGSSTLNVTSQNRDAITFRGQMYLGQNQ